MRQELSSSFTTRQYMLAGQYELYYYSDQVLQLVPIHAHDFYEFYFFLDGNVTIRTRDRLYPLHSGDVVIIPPGVMHQAMSGNAQAADRSPSPPYRRFVLWISPAYLEHLMSMGGNFSRLLGEGGGHVLPGNGDAPVLLQDAQDIVHGGHKNTSGLADCKPIIAIK